MTARSSTASSDAMPDSSFINPEFLFRNGLNIETAAQHILNKYVKYRLDQYTALNAEDYGLWICIQTDFAEFTQAHFAQLSESTWMDLLAYCFSHGY
jgi:hypothetical protein